MRSSDDLRIMEEMHQIIEESDIPDEAKRLVIESEWARAELEDIDCEEKYLKYKKLQQEIEIEAEKNGVPISQMGKGDLEKTKQVLEWSRSTPAGIMWQVLGGELMKWEDAHP